MQPITQRVYYVNHLNFKNSKKNTMQNSIPLEPPVESFERQILKQNEKLTNTLVALTMLVFFKVVTDLLFKHRGARKSSEALSVALQDFKSLKNDKSVPDLGNCKSINKELKTILLHHVNQTKVGSDIISEVGAPKPSNRLLLYGPAGIGKSYFAKIMAKSLDAEYKEVLFSDFNSRWSGEHVENLTALFENLISETKNKPDKRFVVTFNEIDAIIRPVEKLADKSFVTKLEERSVFLNYLEKLQETSPNLTIIGTTNLSPKENGLDKAALSRFQNLVEVPYPDKDCLYEALVMNLDKIKNKDNFIKENESDLKDISKLMAKRKFSFRNLVYVVNEAKNIHLDDKIKDKNKSFEFNYIKEAVNSLKISDGELNAKTTSMP